MNAAAQLPLPASWAPARSRARRPWTWRPLPARDVRGRWVRRVNAPVESVEGARGRLLGVLQARGTGTPKRWMSGREFLAEVDAYRAEHGPGALNFDAFFEELEDERGRR